MTVALWPLSGAWAQWQWVDEGGRTVYSDRPPPISVPERNILRQPRGAAPTVPVSPATAPDATEATTPAPPNANAPELAIDPEFQKKMEAEDKAHQEEEAAVQARNQQIKALNCANARRALAQLEPGRRVSTINEKGETGFMDDATRARERESAQAVVRENCE